ncbi:hypothetical protein [Terasakiella sp.]|uniref:hypothetical protein n=1 Tax=Terasakiella sp. TaxID=2034861 RepID=UPI003AA960DD
MSFLKKLGLTCLLLGICYFGYQFIMAGQAERQRLQNTKAKTEQVKPVVTPTEKPILTSQGSWEYHRQRGTIFTVIPIGKDAIGWDTYLALELNAEEILLSALVTKEEYKKSFNGNPAPYVTYRGKKLVKHISFFRKGQSIPLEILDKKVVNLFPSHENDFQLTANYNYRLTPFLIAYLKKGKNLMVTGLSDIKTVPTFSLNGFSQMYEHDVYGKKPIAWRSNFLPIYLKCEQVGPRKYIWLDSPGGIYALNGQAITAVEQGLLPQNALTGKDYIGRKTLDYLISKGSTLCQ